MNSGDKFSATCASQDFESVILTSSDIPGAELDEPFCKHTVVSLHWWLLCRGITASTSWKKSQLIARYQYVALLHFFNLFSY